MTETGDAPELDTWVDRVKRMTAYADEARDFIRRAGSDLPVSETDLGSVCYLWALADERDVTVCDALSRFDSALFASTSKLDITRGVEAGDTGISFLCTWAIRRPDGRFISVVLSADTATGQVGVEVRHSGGDRRAVGFGAEPPSELYEALCHAFFAVAADR